MNSKKSDLKRQSRFLDLTELAKAAGISEVTLRKTINHVEKHMGFKAGDISALVRMTISENQKINHPCPLCGATTTRPDLCKYCESNSINL